MIFLESGDFKEIYAAGEFLTPCSTTLTLSHSKAEAWETCPRYYYLRYVKKLIPIGHDAKKDFGLLMHAGLDPWFEGKGEDVAILALKLKVEELAAGDDFERANLNQLADEAEKYLRRFFALPESSGGFVPLGTERTFQVILDEGINYTGRVDIVGREHGQLAVGENKTTSSFPTDSYGWSMFKAKWSRSLQLIGYAWAVSQVLGETVRSGTVNLFRRVKEYRQCLGCHGGSKKKLTCGMCGGAGRVPNGENPFAQVSTIMSGWKINLFLESRRRVGKEILLAEGTFNYPPNYHSCDMYGRPCDYVGICWVPGVDWRDPKIEPERLEEVAN